MESATTTPTTVSNSNPNTNTTTSASSSASSPPAPNPMFSPHPPQIPPATRHLLETYAHIPPAQVEAHILAFRAAAWAIHPYPCIGQFRFLDLSIAQVPFYADLLARLRAGETLLDVGCCLGQDVRRVVADGAPAAGVVACDVRREFWELGYAFFGDRESLRVRFVRADVLREEQEEEEKKEDGGGGDGEGLRALDGAVDMVHASSFLHLFDYAQQVRAAVRLVKLLRPGPGRVVFGRQVGMVTPGPYQRDNKSEGASQRYHHDPGTLEKFWMEVSKLAGVELKADCEWDPVPLGERSEDMKAWAEKGIRRLRFAVWTI